MSVHGRIYVSLLAGTVGLCACSGARIERNEASAIGSVRAVISAEMVYTTKCGGFAKSLPALVSAGVLSGDLGGSEQPSTNGYRITLTASDPASAGTCADVFRTFTVTAAPELPGETGIRYFRASDDGHVYTATTADFSNATALE